MACNFCFIYGPGWGSAMRLLLRRTLVLKNSHELSAARCMPLCFRLLLIVCSLQPKIVPNVQECDARNDQ